jgi:hypothetical protein
MDGAPTDETPPTGTPVSDTGPGAASGRPRAPIFPDPAPPSQPAVPVLPQSQSTEAPPMGGAPKRTSSAWYRSDDKRYQSVHRRANPWYRRLGRGVIRLALLAVLAVGLYYGARAGQDWLDRDKLPAPGADVPTIRSTSIQIRSSTPAPELDGTLTFDTSTRAYEFVGRVGGPQDGLQMVKPDGSTVFIRAGGDGWRPATSGDAPVASLSRAIDYLIDDDTSDAILTNRLRRGFVELRSETTEGVDPNRQTRYELTLDTLDFAAEFPLQWESFRDQAIPGVPESADVRVDIWLDSEHVLVRVDAETANWAWQRLTYSDQPFTPNDPSA